MALNNATHIAIGGGVWVAPVGTPIPTTVGAAINAAFKPVGKLNEDGVTVTPSDDMAEINAWPYGAVIRTTHSNGKVEITFTALEQTEAAEDLYWAGKADANGTRVLNAAKYGEQFVLLVRTIDTVQGQQQLWGVPLAELVSRDAINLNHTSIAGSAVTIQGRFDETLKPEAGNIVRLKGAYTPTSGS